MKNIIFQKTIFICIMVIIGTLLSCDDWTESKNVDFTTISPSEQAPELYAKYAANLRAYKENSHFLVFGRLNNVSGDKSNEKDYLRSLPDSLDVVTLANADNFSSFDREDMPDVQKVKGTRVLYGIDLTARKNEFETKGDLIGLMAAYLEGVIKTVTEEGFDGISIIYEGDLGTGSNEEANAQIAALQQLIIQKLIPTADQKVENGKLLVMEGSPLFIPQANRNDFDYYVINTTDVQDVYAVRLQVAYANEYAGVPLQKIILSASPSGKMMDTAGKEASAVSLIASLVMQVGPVAGLDVIDIGTDYYNASKNYPLTNGAIQLLNPSPSKIKEVK